ncbi:MAG: glycosyltransferase [Gemmatimonadales bacterium]|nr:glycosyltransferase [Gemmatimonadales bacterium]
METVLENVAEGLLDQGCDVSVLVAGSDSLDRSEVIIGPEKGRAGRLVRAAVLGNFNSQPLTFSLLSLLRREIESFAPDLVHIHLPNPLATAVWSLLAELRSGHMPALAVWHHADVTRQRMGGVLVRPMTRQFLGRARGICTSSRSLLANSVELAGLEDKVAVIPFGIRSHPWSGVKASRDGPFLFLGRLVPYKGLPVLIEAVRKVPEADLVIVGEGPVKEELEELVSAGNLERRVSMVGSLEQSDIVRLMSRARALVLPSIDSSETFGLVQLEAMASGVPVVATDLPTGVPEVGVDGETGLLVPPGDPDALAGALRKLLTDPDTVGRLGRNGSCRFQERFTRSTMIGQLVTWYETLLGR